MNDRGINDSGNVANFVETEQILIYGDYICSHVQIRGSVPAFWEQSNEIKLLRDDKFTEEAYKKHFECLKALYGKVFCINLLSRTSKNEQMLTNFFEHLFKSCNISDVFYRFIDFHDKCKSQDFTGINDCIWVLKKCIDEFGFYAIDLNENKVIMKQTGVFRINCLDCLDRTNIFMCKLAFLLFANQLTAEDASKKVLDEFDGNATSQFSELIQPYKEVWADNSDILSYHYCGSGSTTSSALRNGWGIKGLLDSSTKSVVRFFNKNFMDKSKQEAIEIMLGTSQGSMKKMAVRGDGVEEVKIYISTWNVGGKNLNDMEDLNLVIGYLLQNAKDKDIIVLGFQEIVKLKAKNVIGPFSNESNKILWLNELSYRLPNYRLIGHANLVGIYMVIFVKLSKLKKISEIETSEAKTGFLNKLGNKGGTSISFKFNDTRFMFVNCHLTSGSKNDKSRIQSLEEIHKRIVYNPKIIESDSKSDYIFILGDFNFRITLGNKEVREMLGFYTNNLSNDMRIISDLLNYDQLEEAKRTNKTLSEYNEGGITFPPTYKYDLGKQTYDTSKKKRTPSWTDRILFYTSENYSVRQEAYQTLPLVDSDHRPVYATFTVQAYGKSPQSFFRQKTHSDTDKFDMKDLKESQLNNFTDLISFTDDNQSMKKSKSSKVFNIVDLI